MSSENRLELHDKLCDILGSGNVYFQPPESIKLKYPCILYSRTNMRKDYADNNGYIHNNQYILTIVYKDPDSDLPERILDSFQMINHERNYKAENLNHDVFILYYKN